MGSRVLTQPPDLWQGDLRLQNVCKSSTLYVFSQKSHGCNLIGAFFYWAQGSGFRHYALECGSSRRGYRFTWSDSGSGATVFDLLVSALCVRTPLWARPRRCTGPGTGVLRPSARETLSGQRQPGARQVSNFFAHFSATLFD